MGQLYDRRCVVIVGRPPPADFVQVVPDAIKVGDASSGPGLRVDFSIEKDDNPKPNEARVSIYNLNQDHREALEAKGCKVILQAGYASQSEKLPQIFSGSARYINSDKVGPDWVTKIECGDSERAYSYARVSQSFGAGTSVKDVIMAVVGALKIDSGNALNVANKMTRQFANGYTAHGLAGVELSRLLDQEQIHWSMQDGVVEMLAELDTIAGNVPLISASTGMIGSPEFGTGDKRKGPAFMKVKTLLRGDIRPGMKFSLKSRSKNGDFKCKKIKHTGSTHGQEWYSTIEAISV